MRPGRAGLTIVALCLTGVCLMGWLFGCTAPTYKVDWDGDKEDYEGAKDRYRAGETVTVYYGLIATDTDYAFYLDGERINTGYEEGKGFVISFTMPAHDVTVSMNSKNSMVWDGFQSEEVLTFHSFDGGGPEYEATVADPAIVACTETIRYNKSNHEQLTGAGYDVFFTLTGKSPGTTTVTVTGDSPIADIEPETYTVTVNEALQIRIEQE